MRVTHLAALLASVAAVPASAAIIGAEGGTITSSGFSFGVTPDAQFNLFFNPANIFDSVSVSTTGTAQVTAINFLGPLRPTSFFPRNPATFGNNGQLYAGFADPALIRFSGTPTDLGLRYTSGGETFFGYVRFSGSSITRYAFNTIAGQSIVAGTPLSAAVPEPASWAMMISGFGLAGYALRRRSVAFAAA